MSRFIDVLLWLVIAVLTLWAGLASGSFILAGLLAGTMAFAFLTWRRLD